MVNLRRLIFEFIGCLHREQGVGFARGYLAGQEIFLYLQKRNSRDLDPGPSMLDLIMSPKPKTPKPPRPVHLLCPDEKTLNIYIKSRIKFFSSKHFCAAIVFEMVPAWLRFLESRGLIGAAQRDKVLADLRPLHNTLREIWKSFDDPLVCQRVQAWPNST